MEEEGRDTEPLVCWRRGLRRQREIPEVAAARILHYNLLDHLLSLLPLSGIALLFPRFCHAMTTTTARPYLINAFRCCGANGHWRQHARLVHLDIQPGVQTSPCVRYYYRTCQSVRWTGDGECQSCMLEQCGYVCAMMKGKQHVLCVL